jgi:hypothetical protein
VRAVNTTLPRPVAVTRRDPYLAARRSGISPEIATNCDRLFAHGNADCARNSPRMNDYMRAGWLPRLGDAGLSALLLLMTGGVLNAIAEPDPDGPQCRKNAAQKEHRGHNRAGGDDEDL